MKLETKLLIFYLSLEEKEQINFRSLLGPRVIDKIISPTFLEEATLSLRAIAKKNVKIPLDFETYDIAVMQLVRHIVESSPSNVELAKSITEITNQKVTRPEKRSNYELQGMLLAALMNASRDDLLKLRNEIMQGKLLATNKESESNLEKWFSIILGAKH
ncbi:MAG: hypothetical protein ABFD75_10550 [Smithella sp.]